MKYKCIYTWRTSKTKELYAVLIFSLLNCANIYFIKMFRTSWLLYFFYNSIKVRKINFIVSFEIQLLGLAISDENSVWEPENEQTVNLMICKRLFYVGEL